MYVLYAIWTHPDDVEAFEKHYEEVHGPLAAAIPGLERLVLSRTSDTLAEEEASPFHRVAELWFADQAALEAAAESPELARAAEDAAEMQERFNVTLHSPAGERTDAPLGPFEAPSWYQGKVA